MAFPDQPAARAALDAALFPYNFGLAFRTYTQASLDGIRESRNAVELAAYNLARAAGAPLNISAPRPVATPVSYPDILPTLTDPTTIAGMKLYLTAKLGVTHGPPAVAAMTAWADQSGSGNDVTSDSADTGHILRFAGGGTTARVFQSGAGGCMKSASATRLFTPGSPRTVFVVAQVTNCNDGCIFLDMQPGQSVAAATVAFGLWNATNLGVVYPATDGVSVSEYTPTPAASFEGVKQIYAYRWPGYGYNVQFSAAGSAFSALSGSPIVAEAGDDGFLIGRFFGTAQHGQYSGALHAILGYDSFLSDSECNRVFQFLRDDWAL